MESTTEHRPTPETYNELQAAYDFFNECLFAGELLGALITLQRAGRTMGHISYERFVNREGKTVDEIAMNPEYFATRPIEDTLSTLAHEMCHQWRNQQLNPGRRTYHDRIWADKMKSIGLQSSHTGQPGGKEVGEKMSHYVLPGGQFIHVCKAFLASNAGLRWFDRFPRDGLKDYAYATDVLVTASFEAGAVAGQDSTEQEKEGAEAAGAPAGDPHAGTPMFSPTPVEEGLQVATVAPAGSAGTKTGPSNRLRYTCSGCSTNVWGKPGIRIDCGDCHQRFAES